MGTDIADETAIVDLFDAFQSLLARDDDEPLDEEEAEELRELLSEAREDFANIVGEVETLRKANAKLRAELERLR